MKIDRVAGWLNERPASEEANRAGSPEQGDGFVAISANFPLRFRLPSKADVTEGLFSNLRLLYGIGEHYDRSLKEEGYGSIPDLLSHRRFGGRAGELLDSWGTPPDPSAVYRTLSAWLPPSHRLFIRSLGLMEREKIVFFDLETLGLANSPVFLIATARLSEGELKVDQYLATSLEGEAPLLEEFIRRVGSTSALISYNGRSFDWPIIRERLFYYGIPLPEEPIHIDLLHHCRRRYRDLLPGFQLNIVERGILGIERRDDLPGSLVPAYYSSYLATGDPAMLAPIVSHNRQDILSLVLLLEALLEENDDAR